MSVLNMKFLVTVHSLKIDAYVSCQRETKQTKKW